MFKRKFIRCSSLVNPNAIRRETVDGIEHIIVTSFTLPDNIVMNGILYPADEIDASFMGLNRTLAPVEHPQNSDGQFVSANDPVAIHSFHAGAFNDNAQKVGNRVKVDKIINVQEALKSDRGRRLLDRINEIEESDSPRPIHTSTGIFLEVEELDEPQTNDDGLEFQMIARNMVFDHDAILLDNQGAATPGQGVGMAVNKNGEKVDVETIRLDINDHRTNQEGLSHRNLIEQLENEIIDATAAEWVWIADVFDDVVIFEVNGKLFTVPYRVDNDVARITGMPIRVERVVTYEPKTNSNEVNAMEKKIRAALNAVGIDTEGMDEDALLAAYNKLLQANNAEGNDDEGGEGNDDEGGDDEGGDDAGSIANTVAIAVSAAIKPLQEQVANLTTKVSADDIAAKSELTKAIFNSSNYPEMDEATLAGLSLDVLKSMSAHCGVSHGLPLNVNADGSENTNSAPSDMPE